MRNELLPPYLRKCRFVAVLAVAQDGTVLDCNDALRDMLKMGGGLAGRPLESLFFPDQPGLLERIGREASLGTNVGILLQDSDGSPISMDFHLEALDAGARILPRTGEKNRKEEPLTKLSSLKLEMGNWPSIDDGKTAKLEEANSVITRLMNTDPLTGNRETGGISRRWRRRPWHSAGGKASLFP